MLFVFDNRRIGTFNSFSRSISHESILAFDGDGNWTYLDDEDRFVFIEYNYNEIFDGETYSDSNEPGDGYLYYGSLYDNGEVKIKDGTLIISNFEMRTYEFKK